MNNFHGTAYGWLMLAGILVSLGLWSRVARKDSRLVLVYVSALAGAFIGAKIAYIVSEGWLHWHDPDRWAQWVTGKSITGALLGGYASVEMAKKMLGYARTTGDWFALIVPPAIVLGRVGCLLHGCCLGRVCDAAWFTMNDATGMARWPAALVELIFNALMVFVFLIFRWKRILPGQHFHIYLICYGLFRFLHEFMRDTPRILGFLSGYQIIALAVAVLGFVGFMRRRQPTIAPQTACA